MMKMAETKEKGFVAVIRVRGMTKVRYEIRDTMAMLGLTRKHSMVIREATPSVLGMIKKAKDYVTYGFVDKAIADRFGLCNTIHLHPPRGGFERGGIKKNFSIGGALGYRGEKISELIEKMSPRQVTEKSTKSIQSTTKA